MGTVQPPESALLLLAAFSRYPDAITWARQRAAATWGPIALESARFPFDQTDYYTPTMGPELWKQFFALATPIDPETLAAIKRATNGWEDEYNGLAGRPEPRPLNLDPGYMTPAKLVLASTKNHAHRIYLAAGIYAEVTLGYTHGNWRSFDWTFPDYRQATYHEFFTRCREYLRAKC